MKTKIATGFLAALILAATFFAGTLMPQAQAASTQLNHVARFTVSAQTSCLDYSILNDWNNSSIGAQQVFRAQFKDLMKSYVIHGGGCADFASLVNEINETYCPENLCPEY